MGRAGYMGDEVGARILVSRLVRDIMRLCFLMEKKFAPYPKWFGTAFKRLESSKEYRPLIEDTLKAKEWKTRDRTFSRVCEYAAKIHNNLELTKQMPEESQSFHNRPFSVIYADNFVKAIRETITDSQILEIPKHLGSVDQFSDSTNLLSYPKLKERIRNVYYQ
jgi:hypothetical protein